MIRPKHVEHLRPNEVVALDNQRWSVVDIERHGYIKSDGEGTHDRRIVEVRMFSHQDGVLVRSVLPFGSSVSVFDQHFRVREVSDG